VYLKKPHLRFFFVLVVYFSDFVDKDNNFAYFSAAHPDMEPYRIVDDDGLPAFDCMLFRFERSSWHELF
jgi:hypothetical protein